MSEHTVFFSAAINPDTAKNFAEFLENIRQQGATEVRIAMNSPGGHVISGIMLYNILRAMPFTLTTHNVGNVDSVGNVVFLAGEQRQASSSATFMFHGVGFDLQGNQRAEEKQLRQMLDTVLADQRRMSELIAERAGLSIEECMELFKEQKTRDASWARENGIVQGILDFTFPSEGNVHFFVR